MAKTASLKIDDKEYPLPVMEGTEGEKAIDTRTLHAQEAIDILENEFDGRVFRSRIKRTVRVAEAPVEGMSLLKYEPEGAAAQSYRDLAQEVMADVQ
jgi:cellulose biosynthesis protein BcsQ